MLEKIMPYIRKYWLHMAVLFILVVAVVITAAVFNSEGGPPEESSSTTASSKATEPPGTGTDTEPSSSGPDTTQPTTSSETESTTSGEEVTVTLPVSAAFPITGITGETKRASHRQEGVSLVIATVETAVTPNPCNLPELGKISIALNDLTDAYIKKADETLLTDAKDSFAKGNIRLPYTMTVEYSIPFNSRHYISFVFKDSTYSGGQIDFPDIKTKNFSASGDILTLSSLFSASTDVYRQRIINDIIEQIGTDTADYYNDYKNLLNTFDFEKRWYFSEQGFVFYFIPYEISVFSAGIVEFTVPYASLSDILKQNPAY